MSTTWAVRGAMLALTLGAAAAGAQQPVAGAAVGEGTLWFDGRASLGDFVGTTSSVTGRLTGSTDLAQVSGWVEAPVATLVTGNDRRDRDLRKSMVADSFPTIRFDLARIAVGERTADTTTVQLEGTFTLHGVTRPVTIPARVLLGEHRYHVWATTPVNLKDYAIGGLSKMLGLLKMSENIVVHVDVLFEVP